MSSKIPKYFGLGVNDKFEQRKLFIATKMKHMKTSSSDNTSWSMSFLEKNVTGGIDCFANLDKTIDFPRDGSEGKHLLDSGNPRTKCTDSLVREMTLPLKTISADL